MRAFPLALAILIGGGALAQESDLIQRTLRRAFVSHCRTLAPNPPPIVIVTPTILPDGTIIESNVSIVGDPIPLDTNCAFIDSYVGGVDIEGGMVMFRSGEGPFSGLIYNVSIRDGSRAYTVADWAIPIDWTDNGARYEMESLIAFDESGAPLRYPLSILRNGSSFAEDKSTIFQIHLDVNGDVVIIMVDYRDG